MVIFADTGVAWPCYFMVFCLFVLARVNDLTNRLLNKFGKEDVNVRPFKVEFDQA
jgi:hypothetical protein